MSGLLPRRPWFRPGIRCKVLSAKATSIPRYQSPCLLQIQCYTSPAPSSRPAGHPRGPTPPPTTNLLDAVIADHQHKPPSGPSKQTLYEAFGEHTAAGGAVSDHLGYSVVSTLLTPRAPNDAEFPDQVPDADKELALRVLEYLSLQGTPVLVMGTFAMLYQAAIFSPPQPRTTVDTDTDDDFFAPSPSARKQDDNDIDAATRISRMITALHLPYHPDDARSLMTMLFQNGDDETFWKLWRRIPLQGAPRSAEDYAMLFRLHAQLGDPRRAERCVLLWFPMMAREGLPASAAQGEIARLVVRCIDLPEVGTLKRVSEGRQLEQLMQIRDEAIQAAAMWSKGENEHPQNR